MSQTTTEILSTANELLASHTALIQSVRLSQQQHRRQLQALDSPPQELLRLPLISTTPPPQSPTSLSYSDDDDEPVLHHFEVQHSPRPDLSPSKRARAQRYRNYVPEEETIRNDYSQRYVDTGEWPQNWVLGAEPEHRFEEYPKQQRLLSLKKTAVAENALPPLFLPYADLQSLHPSKFDVILLDPPYSSSFTWDHLQELPVPSLAADPSFVFLWVGSGAGEGLERGREILAKWGYRRCEDVVWVKTNKTSNAGPGTDPPTTSLLTRTKQHCLIGIRGTVRRSTDSWFVHCNVDTDVIFWEGDSKDPTRKPPEMYTLIENFCLGYRRLEIFGRISSLRRGWVTAMSPDQMDKVMKMANRNGTVHVDGEEGGAAGKWVRETWEEGVKERMTPAGTGPGAGKAVVSMTSEIEALRPKSPNRMGAGGATGGGALGGGVGLGGQPVLGVGGVPLATAGGSRFMNGGRAGVGAPGMVGGPAQVMGQNPMMVQPMMGMGINSLGMGMGPGVGVGVGMGVPVGMGGGMGDEMSMMAGWNPMVAAAMGGMNMNMGMGRGGGRIGQMGMMGPMGMGMGGGFGGGWDQGQFGTGGIEGGWDGEGLMNLNMGMNMDWGI